MSAKKTDFIVMDLISKIYQNRFFNYKLPTQRDLAYAYQVSRFTIQKALKKLRAIGLVEFIQGNGIYIRERALGNPLVYNSLTEVSYNELQSRVLSLNKVKAGAEMGKTFNLAEDQDLWQFQRLRIVNYEISQLETSYMPCHLFADISKEVIEDSIQNYVLKQKYQISYFMTNYQAGTLTREESELMNVRKGSPAMRITSRGLLKDGSVFILSNITAINYECTYIIPFNKQLWQSRRKQK